VPTQFSRRRLDAGCAAIVPRLLVSVRSADEALSAIHGGADILDVKEPAHGSLGMADIQVISDIAFQMTADGERLAAPPPLSVALGELSEWIDEIEFPSLPSEVTFAKLGLSRLKSKGDWRTNWQRVREKFDEGRIQPLRWVAVAYADAQVAQAPSLDEVLAAAIDTGCAGLLIDTFGKRGSTLLDLVAADDLTRAADRCHSAGLFFALAGRLSLTDLQQLSSTNADILAIRSAACIASNRESQIEGSRVAAFRQAMIHQFTPNL